MKTIRNIVAIILVLVTLSALMTNCTRKVYVPVEHTRTEVITKHDTVVSVKLEKEVVKIQTKDTTAYAETKYAEAKATWNGNDETLQLELVNKNALVEVVVEYVERVVTDSVHVPYPVEKVVKERHVPIWFTIVTVGLVVIIIFILCRWER